jgi:hypothetical protein
MAAIWTAGRESVLVDDRLDRTTEEAMNAVLSQVNDCPYCGDTLISLVHAAGQHQAASNLFDESEASIADGALRTRLSWVRSVETPGTKEHSAAVHRPGTARSDRGSNGHERYYSLQSC